MDTDRRLLTGDEFCQKTGIGRTLFYALVHEQKIRVIKFGRSTYRWPYGKMTRVPASELLPFHPV